MGSILSIDSPGSTAGIQREGRVKIHPSEDFERAATQTDKFFLRSAGWPSVAECDNELDAETIRLVRQLQGVAR
jgi:hypothetical protein